MKQMTRTLDAPRTRTEKFWNHWGRAAVVTSSTAAAWLLCGTAEAEDFYLRAGISLDRPAETQFTDEDCSERFPGCSLWLRHGRRRRAAPLGWELQHGCGR